MLCSFNECNSLAEAGSCSKCLSVSYCCSDHQKQHWKVSHKYECKGVLSDENINQLRKNHVRISRQNTRQSLVLVTDNTIEPATVLFTTQQDSTFSTFHKRAFFGDLEISSPADVDKNSVPSNCFVFTNLIVHSCQPNCVIVVNQDQNSIQLISQANIKKGDVIQVSYYPWITDHFPLSIRKQELMKYFNFSCVCHFCLYEQNQADLLELKRGKSYLNNKNPPNDIELWSTYQSIITNNECDLWLSACYDIRTEYELTNHHWFVYVIRILFERKNIEEGYLFLSSMYEFIRAAIYRLSLWVQPLAIVKSNYYKKLQYIGQLMKKKETEIYSDILRVDEYYEHFRFVWYGKEAIKMPDNLETKHINKVQEKLRNIINEKRSNRA